MAMRPLFVTLYMPPTTRDANSIVSPRLDLISESGEMCESRLQEMHTTRWFFEVPAPEIDDVEVCEIVVALHQSSSNLGRGEYYKQTLVKNHRIGEEIGSLCQRWRSVLKLEATPHIRGKPNSARWTRPGDSPRRRARSQSHDGFWSLMSCQVLTMWMRMERRIRADISPFRI